MIRSILALSLALTPLTLPTFAEAQSCTPRPANKHCLNRFPPGQVIDNRTGGPTGTVSCEAEQANKVQYDLYLLGSGGYDYSCTFVLTCSQVQSSDPAAYTKFC